MSKLHVHTVPRNRSFCEMKRKKTASLLAHFEQIFTGDVHPVHTAPLALLAVIVLSKHEQRLEE